MEVYSPFCIWRIADQINLIWLISVLNTVTVVARQSSCMYRYARTHYPWGMKFITGVLLLHNIIQIVEPRRKFRPFRTLQSLSVGHQYQVFSYTCRYRYSFVMRDKAVLSPRSERSPTMKNDWTARESSLRILFTSMWSDETNRRLTRYRKWNGK